MENTQILEVPLADQMAATTEILKQVDVNLLKGDPAQQVELTTISDIVAGLESIFRALNTPAELLKIEGRLTADEKAAWDEFLIAFRDTYVRALKVKIALGRFDAAQPARVQ